MSKVLDEIAAQRYVFAVDPWKITENRFDSSTNQVSESIFSLANEYMGCRGNFEECLTSNTLEGCYIGGIYFKERWNYIWERPGFVRYGNSIINTTNWLVIKICIDGEDFSMDNSDFSGYIRELDMQKGIVTRSLVFQTESGLRTSLKWERFISHDDRHLAAIRLSVTAINHEQPIRIEMALDSTKENSEFGTSTVQCRGVGSGSNASSSRLAMNVISTGQYYQHQMRVGTNGVDVYDEDFTVRDRYVSRTYTFNPKKGREYHFDKLVSVWTSRDMGYPYGLISKECDSTSVDSQIENGILDFLQKNSESHLRECSSLGYEALKKEHSMHLASVWDNIDIEIMGDPIAQQGIRFCTFQLLSTYLGNDSYLNVAPKGHTGENYNGRAFWDTESYCLPFYLFANPEAARGLVEYRYNGLDAARERAKELDHAGAVFPMTTMDGTEDCATWEYSLGEVHANSIIAYAVFIYANVTGDREYLYSKGAEVLVEIARFWASRCDYIPNRSGYGINIVMGPDEWHQFVNNDFYTNYMAKWVLEYTADLVGEMNAKSTRDMDILREKSGFDISEVETWRRVADGLIINWDPEYGIYPQDDGFMSLALYYREHLDAQRDLPVERKWTVEKKLKYQMLKQPSVLLAMYYMSHCFSLGEKIDNYRFYEQRTAHGSSLSPCIHSILASEIGRHSQAYDYYLHAARTDLDDRGHNTHEGLHITSMAGTWMSIVCGFGGLRYGGNILSFSPVLPDAWEGYSFKLRYRNSVIKVNVNKQCSEFKILAGPDVRAEVYGEEVVITSDATSMNLPAEFLGRPRLKAVIFDLDGVLVDTARCHFKAWKAIADAECIYFDEKINERLKGVSRMESLSIIMERANKTYSEKELQELAQKKNALYCEMIREVTPNDILPGIPEFLSQLHDAGIKTAVCSASRNTLAILDQLEITDDFQAVVTGNDVSNSKPDPECVFLAASRLGVDVSDCLVIEDAAAGIQAAVSAGAKSIGIGDKLTLHLADYTISSTKYLTLDIARSLY